MGVPAPNDPGSGPDTYCFEKSLTKTGGRAGFADVWKRDHFAWEYKGKGKYPNLDAAYAQLLLYKEDIGNPPILVVSDIANYEVHIAFMGYRTRIERFPNADLAKRAQFGSHDTSKADILLIVEPVLMQPLRRANWCACATRGWPGMTRPSPQRCRATALPPPWARGSSSAYRYTPHCGR